MKTRLSSPGFPTSFPLRALAANLADVSGLHGSYQVLNAWDNGLSPYVVCINAGFLVDAADLEDSTARFSLLSFEGYMARGFTLLRCLSAIASHPSALDGNEDALGLGLLSD